jgi:hypothetical protein
MDRQPLGFRHRDAVADPVEGPDRGPPGAEDHARRLHPRRPVRRNRRPQRRTGHGAVGIRCHLHQVALPDPRHPDRLVDRGMRLGAGIEAQGRPGRQPVLQPPPPQRRLAHRQHRRERRVGRRIVDRADKPLGQAHGLAQPVDHHLLDFRRCGRGLPDQRVARHRIDQLFGQHRGRGGVRGEIGEEARMLPMGHPPRNDPLEIGPDRFHRLGRLGRGRRHLARHRAGDQRGPHRPVAQTRVVIRRPVGRPLRPVPQAFVIHARPPQFPRPETMSPENRQGSTAKPTRKLLFPAMTNGYRPRRMLSDPV